MVRSRSEYYQFPPTLTDEALSVTIGCESSKAVWDALHSAFQRSSTAGEPILPFMDGTNPPPPMTVKPHELAPSRVVNPETDKPHELAPASNKAVRLQFLDVVLRKKPSNVYTVVGRSFFHPSLSLQPTQMGLSLNVDISARAFFEPIYTSVYVMKYLNKEIRGPLSDQDRLKVKKTLKAIRVEVNHQKNIRRYKISDISKEPIQQLMFTADASGARISVVEYFRQTYNISLKYTMLPAIQAGSDSKPIYLPMELCQIIPGQRYMKKLNDCQVTEMLRATCQRPKDRQDSIQKACQSSILQFFNSKGMPMADSYSPADAPPENGPVFSGMADLVTTKLSSENFLNWQSQILPLVTGSRLLPFMDGTNPPPPMTVTDKSNKQSANPEYLSWYFLDQKIISFLLSTLTDEALSVTTGCESSKAVWDALHSAFQRSSTAGELPFVSKKLHVGESSSSEQPLAVAPSRVVNPETDKPHELTRLNGLEERVVALSDENAALKRALQDARRSAGYVGIEASMHELLKENGKLKLELMEEDAKANKFQKQLLVVLALLMVMMQ